MRCYLPAVAVAFLCVTVFAVPVLAHDGHRHSSKPSSGPASAYAFPLPEPGTYRLPPIRTAAGGRVLTEDGAETDLASLLSGRITVFSFIYTRCTDICPVATMQLAQLRESARRHPTLDGRLRLVSMSFDPDHDTPAVMGRYGSWWRAPEDGGAEWLFLAPLDHQSLRAVLAAYDQAVAPKPDPQDPTGGLNHILRVFLIDEAGVIRNIYSMDFLDPDLVLADIRTLAH
jgi:cytochrome oxidase Cu insertion factor (SCO1/SenC/PrrC family)